MLFNVNSIQDLDKVAKSILENNLLYRKFALYGEMGVGKTTLIKSLSLHLGVCDIVSSPTFSIINEYLNKKQEKIYHFDFYRINNENEAYDIGLEEYIFSSNFCFIEWPEKVPSLINNDMLKIYMYVERDNSRIIKVKK